MLRNLPHQRLAIGLGHPVLRLDLAVGLHHRVKAGLFGCGGARGRFACVRGTREVEGLGVHAELHRLF
jgi:hypothetical protein